ncbi:hypothetical protein BF940_03675 [Campylobacter jejuni]|nr:hypothetical protein [Campylobacter jejuni]ECO1974329.1 hypothetical protein [Campylobacter jejuni]ECO1974729.1 hypothetical protein [Campylobacter jejuni]EHC3425085.1 hypothetical protein [Campylobacter jejuni]EIB1396939.1 hypothetical protein [Campylobacter jejuni]
MNFVFAKRFLACLIVFLNLSSFAKDLEEKELQEKLEKVLDFADIIVKAEVLPNHKKIVRLVVGFIYLKKPRRELTVFDLKEIEKTAKLTMNFQNGDELLIYNFDVSQDVFFQKRFDELLKQNHFKNVYSNISIIRKNDYFSCPPHTICEIAPLLARYWFFMEGQYHIKIYSPYVLNENKKNKIKTLIKTELLKWFGKDIARIEFEFKIN